MNHFSFAKTYSATS